MKKILSGVLLIILSVFMISGCTKATEDGKRFKEEYEALNGQKNSSGKEHRSVDIDKTNPFVYATAEEIVKKAEAGETFYVYFGDTLCPWCRSVIEKFIEIAKENKVDKVYYVKIWDDDGNEILRDRYNVSDNGKIETVFEGTDAYFKLLDLFENVLSDYNLTDSNGNRLDFTEKRIYAPNFIYVENGKAVALTEGISESLEDPRGELTKEILKDEEKQFEDFFAK